MVGNISNDSPNIDFEESELPVTTEDIAAFESRFDIPFPKDLAQHYLKVNGGIPSLCKFVTDDSEFIVHYFLAIKYGESDITLEHMYATLVVKNEDFPSGVIPFAVDPGGDFFVYNVSDQQGAVQFYRSEYYGQPDALVKLTSSFSEFLHSLQPDEE